LQCLTGRGQCSVAHGTRRRCQRCRLNRCFAIGMRKDFMHSKEEKQRRRKSLEENRNMTSQRSSTSESTNSLSISNPLLNCESLSPAFDEIDRVSFYFSTLI
jgi:nuclear receptor subfamily 1 group I